MKTARGLQIEDYRFSFGFVETTSLDDINSLLVLGSKTSALAFMRYD